LEAPSHILDFAGGLTVCDGSPPPVDTDIPFPLPSVIEYIVEVQRGGYSLEADALLADKLPHDFLRDVTGVRLRIVPVDRRLV